MMLLGTYFNNVDAKSRLVIPSTFREKMDGKLIITRGVKNSLSLYTYQVWEKKMHDILARAENEQAARPLLQLLASRSSECAFDTNGRILLPHQLMKEIGLHKECAVVGVLDHLEIWDKNTWEEYYQEIAQKCEQDFSLGGII